MSARDVITRCLGKGAELAADEILTQLAFDGYTILGPDEIHAPSVERCRDAYEAHDSVGRDWVPGSLWDQLNREGAQRVAALRELMKEVGRG